MSGVLRLRFAARRACGARKEILLCLPGTYSSARKRALGNVPGYYRSSLAGLGYCGRELAIFPQRSEKRRPDTRRSGRVSPFSVVQGRRETEARIGCGAIGPSFPALPLMRMTFCSAAILRGAALLARGGPAKGYRSG